MRATKREWGLDMPFNLNIPGWMCETDLVAIENLARQVPKGGKIVEIGSCCGRSSWAWAKSCDPSVTVYCIDIWMSPEERAFTNEWGLKYLMKGDLSEATILKLDPFQEFQKRTKDCPNIVPIRGSSPGDMVWNFGEVDLVFIDDEHTYEQLMANYDFWYSKIKPGGILCGHDYEEKGFPQIIRGVNDIGQRLNCRYDLLGYSIWSLKVPTPTEMYNPPGKSGSSPQANPEFR